jgi:hypothetical protein
MDLSLWCDALTILVSSKNIDAGIGRIPDQTENTFVTQAPPDESTCPDELTRLGYSVQMCLTDFGETAEAAVQSRLEQKRYDCVLIGAGVRANPSYFMLFEKLINVVHQHAPQAKICFNTLPSDTAAAVKRWL